ncbi:MFS transporter [Nocardia sp. NPDC050435]|uniref:MFS transporter n=1 Tax=Nocardia sp. NPDC050435 TaxID=3155040 RepID=UPI0033D14AD0
MGLVAIAGSVPFVVIGIFGRRLVARVATFPILAGVDIIRSGLAAAVLVWWSLGRTPTMLVLVALLGICGAVFDPAWGSMAPELVAEHERADLVALMDMTGRIARIAGPALAGVVRVAAPLDVLFAADAATFAVSAGALVWLARTATTPRTVSASTRTRSNEAVPGGWCGPIRVAAHRCRDRGAGRESAKWRASRNGNPIAGKASRKVSAWSVLREHLSLAIAFGVQGVGFLTSAELRPEAGFPGRFRLAWASGGVLLVGTGAAPGVAWVVVGDAVGIREPVRQYRDGCAAGGIRFSRLRAAQICQRNHRQSSSAESMARRLGDEQKTRRWSDRSENGRNDNGVGSNIRSTAITAPAARRPVCRAAPARPRTGRGRGCVRSC